MTRSAASIVVLSLTVLTSLGLSAIVARHVSLGRASSSTANVSDESLERLVVRLEQIERRLSEPNRPQDDLRERAKEQRDESAPPNLSTLEERLQRLEEIERSREEAAARRAEQRRQIEEQRREQAAQLAAVAVQTMLDPSASDVSKQEAWRQMRMSASSVWTDTIVSEAVRIGSTSPDPQVRADVWRQAHARHTHPLLLQPLLHALANDPDATVREEAAETLDLYLEQPGVREALVLASDYDAAPTVRRQATISLSGPTGGL